MTVVMHAPSAPGAAGFDARRVVRGFEHLRRFHEPNTGHMSVKILPGEYYATAQDEVITTVLGSCVSACIHDPDARVGGMNHFMLPEPATNGGRWGDTAAGRSARYGSDAMEQLVNTVLKAGGERGRLRVKIFGGGRILAQMTDIGKRNIVADRRGRRRHAAAPGPFLSVLGAGAGAPAGPRRRHRPGRSRASLPQATGERSDKG